MKTLTGTETKTVSGIDNIESFFSATPGKISEDYREKIEAGDMWLSVEFDHDNQSVTWCFEESNSSHASFEDDYDGCLDFFEDEEDDYDKIMDKVKTRIPVKMPVCVLIACIDNYSDFDTTICVDEILDYADANDILTIDSDGNIMDENGKVSGKVIFKDEEDGKNQAHSPGNR